MLEQEGTAGRANTNTGGDGKCQAFFTVREENTSYQEVLDQTRARLSVKYLETTDLSVAEIAYRLGYEHPTNFTRAFRKWTNKSPSDYRPEQTRPE